MVCLGVGTAGKVKSEQCALLDDSGDSRADNLQRNGVCLAVAALGIELDCGRAVGVESLNLLADRICLRDIAIVGDDFIAIHEHLDCGGLFAGGVGCYLNLKIVVKANDTVIDIIVSHSDNRHAGLGVNAHD